MHPSWPDIERDVAAATAAASLAVETDGSLAQAPAPFRLSVELAPGKHLHDAYCAIERAVERLVVILDGGLPIGRRWHQDLLDRAGRAMEGGRGAILGAGTVHDLRLLLAFRHLYRNIYGDFDYPAARPLVPVVARCVPRAAAEIETFCVMEGLKDSARPRRFPPPA
ncbi:MAG: hypothetical protein K2X11_17465 [Acetobacteraceae bacterium]|nr:hypothetical protein [Acetobacteraceae bacterium]